MFNKKKKLAKAQAAAIIEQQNRELFEGYRRDQQKAEYALQSLDFETLLSGGEMNYPLWRNIYPENKLIHALLRDAARRQNNYEPL